MVDRSAPLRLAAGRRIARDVQVDVEHEPRTALGAHEVDRQHDVAAVGALQLDAEAPLVLLPRHRQWALDHTVAGMVQIDRKSTRLNSSHSQISYAVFCLKKKTTTSIDILSPHSAYAHQSPAHKRD